MQFHEKKIMGEIRPGYTRVTQIIGQFYPYPAGARAAVERKGRIGTSVHEGIQLAESGVYSIVPEECEGYFKAYQEWRKINERPFILVEQRFYDDDWMITGQIDALWEGVIVDFKTSREPNLKKWKLQAAFYSYLVDNGATTARFVQLRPDGTFEEFVFSRLDEMFPVLEACVLVHKYFSDASS